MQLSVVTPEGILFEGEVNQVQLPAFDGYLGIWPDHAPLLTELGAGYLEAQTTSGQEKIILSGGYLQVLNNKISVLATQAYRQVADIDFQRIENELREALELPAVSDEEFLKKEKAINQAKRLLSIKSH